MPDEVAQVLSKDASTIAAANLRSAVECERLRTAFDGAGVDVLFIKGLTLGARAYGSPTTKAAVDIDILVAPDQLSQAAQELAKLGYDLTIPAGPVSGLAAWHHQRKESVWLQGDSGLQVDLHTRLADSPMLIPAVGMASPRQTIEVAEGIRLPTLATEELFAYLAVHGAWAAWFRLKWISDFAAMLHGEEAGEIERLHSRSQQLGAGRAAGQALLLADSLFNTLGPLPALRDELTRSRSQNYLFQSALRQLAGRTPPLEPTERRLGTLWIHWLELLLLPGLT